MLGFLKNLFFPSSPAAWTPLVRPAKEERRRTRWVQEQVYLNWMGPYFKAYHFQKIGVRGQHLQVRLLQERGRQGVLLLYDPSIGPGNFRHFFDFIRDRVLGLGYNVATSDYRTQRHPRCTETVLKHFLKPQPKDCTETGRCHQRFGTVTVDLVYLNKRPAFIRFCHNPYQDHIFTPARSFDELMDLVFNLPPAPPAVRELIGRYAKA